MFLDGKRLYEYARNNLDVELPKRIVSIYRKVSIYYF